MMLKREGLKVVGRGAVGITLVLAALLLAGCINNKRVDSNSANISIIANRTNNLKADMSDLRTQVDKLLIQAAGLNEKIDAIAGVRKPYAGAGATVRPEEATLLEQELSIVEKRIESLEQKKNSSAPNIKVLAGTTELQPAKDMAMHLTRNGFPVQAVDYASSSDYMYDTVYYAEGYEDQAQSVAETLGGKTVIKPLSWNSVFDVIAVKGRL